MTEEAAATPHGAGDRRASPYPTDQDPTDEAAFLTGANIAINGGQHMF